MSNYIQDLRVLTGDFTAMAWSRRSLSPRPAVDAIVAVQRPLELQVRMGVATGEAEVREADPSARC